jgi:hypothetical protein
MTAIARTRIVWVTLIGVLLMTAQILIGAHFHTDSNHSDEQPPAHECSICLITSTANGGAGPVPSAVVFKLPNVHAEQAPSLIKAFTLQRLAYTGHSPRGPPFAPNRAG